MTVYFCISYCGEPSQDSRLLSQPTDRRSEKLPFRPRGFQVAAAAAAAAAAAIMTMDPHPTIVETQRGIDHWQPLSYQAQVLPSRLWKPIGRATDQCEVSFLDGARTKLS